MKRTDLRHSEILVAQARDAELAGFVLAQLVANRSTRGRRMDVDVVDRVVTLRGIVGTDAERMKAVQIALATPDVAAVHDRIRLESEIEGDAGRAFRIEVEIAARLADHPRIHRTDVELVLDDDVVTLWGIVDDPSVVERAVQIAASVDGVQRVRNHLHAHRRA